MDLCAVENGIKVVEFNCLNSSGFYNSDVCAIIKALDDSGPVAQRTEQEFSKLKVAGLNPAGITSLDPLTQSGKSAPVLTEKPQVQILHGSPVSRANSSDE